MKPNIPPRSDDPDFFPHQLWTFTASGTMRIMKRATPFKADELGKFIHVSSHEPSMTTSYQVYAERAALVMSPQGAPSPYLFSCLVVAQAHEAAGLKPGDLLLDLRTADGREIVLGHHLRKLQ
ncbi:MAG: hypothetical protein HY352_00845 [Candidatus Omnitrophica bacterium]|nr:hypothetical protein [Candidatus Omnitrophota bacterium]